MTKGRHPMLLKSDYGTNGLRGKFLQIWPVLVLYLNSSQLPFCPVSEGMNKLDRYCHRYHHRHPPPICWNAYFCSLCFFVKPIAPIIAPLFCKGKCSLFRFFGHAFGGSSRGSLCFLVKPITPITEYTDKLK